MFGSVVASKLRDGDKLIGEHVAVELPEISMSTQDFKGAGIMGTMNLPTTGQIDSMECKVSRRGLSANAVELERPGTHKLSLTFSQDYLTSAGETVPKGSKINVLGTYKSSGGGSVEDGEPYESDVTYEVLRYEIYIDGKEILLIDKRARIHRVNGVDYMELIRSQLG